jgi:platelet-activating factor acetylhydrolase IB subunit beta/gamma
MKSPLTLLGALLLAPLSGLPALDYPHITAEPQKTGWPLTAVEKAYVTEKPEYERRPGRESNKHLPQLWPQVPTAGHFGGDSWLKLHEAHVKTVQANQGPLDVLLVGDSITIQWGESWKKHFPDLKAVNIGIGGDKTQNVLWRLDHGGVDGLQPKAIVLMIGNNNMFFTPETGVEAAAKGIEMCVKNLREKFPAAKLILAKILPAHAPGNRFYEDIKKTNATLNALKLDSEPKVRLLDLTADFTNADGTLKKDLFTPDNIHLSPAGYAVYAERLKPLLAGLTAAAKPQTREQYLLLNYSTSLHTPNQAQDMMRYVRDNFGAANRESRLKAGLAIIYTPKEQVAETATRLRSDLALAQQMDVPVLIQVDTENWLPESLTNWFDPSKPGYDPTKVNDVEWYGWTPDTAVKLCWRNWGTVVRVGPHPNLLSPRFQAWEKSIYAVLAPVVVEWLAALPAEKQWLFVGWKCGWETTPNSQYAYFKEGNSYLNRSDNPKWVNEDKQYIGYNAARTAGIQTSGVLNYEQSYDVFMKIIGAHLSFLAKAARSLGLPREKLFAHTIAQGVDRYNMESQFNADSNPSPSFYGKPTTSLRDNPSFMRCLAKAHAELGTTGYGIGEFVFGAKDYDTWHRWFTEKLAADPDLIFAALYNYDTMRGRPDIERALLDAMKKNRR